MIVSFVGIGGIVGDHCLNGPFIITFNEMIDTTEGIRQCFAVACLLNDDIK